MFGSSIKAVCIDHGGRYIGCTFCFYHRSIWRGQSKGILKLNSHGYLSLLKISFVNIIWAVSHEWRLGSFVLMSSTVKFYIHVLFTRSVITSCFIRVCAHSQFSVVESKIYVIFLLILIKYLALPFS